MADTKIPDTFNGEPTKYTFFDGFTKASFPMKVVYVLGFPAISAIMEGYRYNKAKHNETDARNAIENGQLAAAALTAPISQQSIVNPSLAMDEVGTKFQDALRLQAAQQTARSV